MKKLEINKPRKFVNTGVGDFETTTMESEYFKKHNTGTIIAGGIQELGNEENYYYGCNYKSLEEGILSLKGNHQMYYHNLGKFDGFVFFSHALNNGANQFTNIQSEISYSFSGVRNKILNFVIKTKNAIISICDSFQLLSLPLARLAKSVGLEKLETNYDIEPVEKVEDLPKDYLEYLKRDCLILNRVLLNFSNDIEELAKKYEINIAGNKKTIASLSRHLIEKLDINRKYKISFESQEIASDYARGGFTFQSTKARDKLVKKELLMIDAKSHYPSVMYLNELPAFEPVKIRPADMKDYHCIFVHIEGTIAKVKTCGGTLYRKNAGIMGEIDNYISEGENIDFEFHGTLEEGEMQEEFYEFSKGRYVDVWGFEETQNVLNPLIRDLYKYKEEKANPLTFKILLNSMYGSCGMKLNYPERGFCEADKQPEPFMKEAKKSYVYSHPYERQFFPGGVEYEYATLYNAESICWNKGISAYITSIGRARLMKFIALKPDSVYYCDTDSMIIDKDYPLEKIKLGKGLGEGGIEVEKADTLYIQGPKRYVLGYQGNIVKHAFAGMDKNYLPKEFEKGLEIFNRQVIKDGQKRCIIKEQYGGFPLITTNDLTNHRRKDLDKWQNQEKDLLSIQRN